jgi:sugar transferase (PEP-CTERM system associated)
MIRIFNQYVSAKALLLMFLEDVLIALSLLMGARLRFWSEPAEFANYVQFPDFILQVLTVVIIFQASLYYGDLYNLSMVRRRPELLISLGQSLGTGTVIVGLVYYLIPNLLIGRGVFFIGMSLLVGSIVFFRVTLDHAWQLAAPARTVLIMGTRQMAVTVARELLKRDDLNMRLAGFVSEGPGAPEEMFGCRVFEPDTNLESLAQQLRIGRIIVALEDQRGSLPIRDLVRLRVQGLRIDDAHTTVSALTGRVWLTSVKPSWFVFSDGFHRARPALALKRAFDLIFGVIGLVVAAPVMAAVAVIVRLDSKGDVIYRQSRVGLGGKTFDVLKFRSMRTDAEAGVGAQWATKNDPRVTTVGRYLRKFRFDELPQFINVIRGEMSFVGPRPERPVFVDQLRTQISYYDERHSVRPGLTGWAQVQYPYGASVEDAFRKLEYDLFYLKNMSIVFDVAILFQTIRTVVTGKGAQ